MAVPTHLRVLRMVFARDSRAREGNGAKGPKEWATIEISRTVRAACFDARAQRPALSLTSLIVAGVDQGLRHGPAGPCAHSRGAPCIYKLQTLQTSLSLLQIVSRQPCTSRELRYARYRRQQVSPTLHGCAPAPVPERLRPLGCGTADTGWLESLFLALASLPACVRMERRCVQASSATSSAASIVWCLQGWRGGGTATAQRRRRIEPSPRRTGPTAADN